MSALSAIFWGVLTLSFLVMIHEGGHFLMARACGIRVTEFFLGLPCKYSLSFKSKKYGTVFGVTPFLLGGYNRICGMEGSGSEHIADVCACVQRAGRTTSSAIAAELGIDEETVFSDLMILSSWATIKDCGELEVESVDQSLVPEGASGQTIDVFSTLRRDAQLFTEFDAAHDFSVPGASEEGEPRPLDDPQAFIESERSHTFIGKSFIKRICVLLAGVTINILFALIVVTGVFMTTELHKIVDTNVISGVEAGSLAEQAGLQAGDAIVEAAGVPCSSWTDVIEALDGAFVASEPFELVYERAGEQTRVTIDLPPDGSVERIGIYATSEPYYLSFPEAARYALSYAWLVITKIAQLFIPQHTSEILAQSSSVVGISVMASEAAGGGFRDLISLMAAVSMSLGVMNLIPLLPLDGGKVVIQTVEALMRRPVSVKVQNAFTYVGLAFFMCLFAFAVYNDVTKIMFG